MAWPFSRKKSPWQGRNLMDLIPEQGLDAETDPETGKVTLLMPRYTQWPFNRLIQPRLGRAKRHIRVPLEDRGSFLWSLCDGRRTIGSMVPEFARKFPQDSEDVPQRLGMYLFQMHENGMIRFANLDL